MTEADLERSYSEHGYAVFRRCLAYLGDAASANEVVLEVFVKAVRAGALAGEAGPRAFLCRTADRLCLERLRGARTLADPAEPESAAALAAAILDDDREAFAAIRRLMVGLDPAARRLAVLHYLDEHTPEEIAEELGLSRRAVDKRLEALERYARTQLDRKSTA